VISVFKCSCSLGGTGRHLTWHTAQITITISCISRSQKYNDLNSQIA